jgi:hypothetical protein
LASRHSSPVTRHPGQVTDDCARYLAGQFVAHCERSGKLDALFLADGGSDYESVKGIVAIARENTKTQVLTAGKTKPSDATLDDFRALRTKVNKAALNGRLSAYYVDSTWETKFPTFKTTAETEVYHRLPDGTAILDGYPIVWIKVNV